MVHGTPSVPAFHRRCIQDRHHDAVRPDHSLADDAPLEHDQSRRPRLRNGRCQRTRADRDSHAFGSWTGPRLHAPEFPDRPSPRDGRRCTVRNGQPKKVATLEDAESGLQLADSRLAPVEIKPRHEHLGRPRLGRQGEPVLAHRRHTQFAGRRAVCLVEGDDPDRLLVPHLPDRNQRNAHHLDRQRAAREREDSTRRAGSGCSRLRWVGCSWSGSSARCVGIPRRCNHRVWRCPCWDDPTKLGSARVRMLLRAHRTKRWPGSQGGLWSPHERLRRS